MAWVRFVKDWDWRVSRVALVAYPAGQFFNVPRACRDAAIRAGAAVPARKLNKNSEPEVIHGESQAADAANI
ncbi:hypothetical protein [Rhizobium phage RHph_X2_26]|nr:hypothetical protein [Rhizobium phage RHph_X2_26]